MSRLTRAALAMAVAALSCAVLTFTRVDFVRAKIVRQSVAPIDGHLSARLPPDAAAKLRSPFAVVVNVSNGGGAPAQISIDAGGAVCARTIAAGRSARIDCASAPAAVVPQAIEVTGPPAGWTVEAIEVASHFGRTTGLGDFYVLPGGTTAAVRPSMAAAVAFACVVFLLWCVPPVPMPSAIRLVHRIALGVAAVVWLVAAASQFAPMSVRFSMPTLLGWTAVIAAPRLWRVAAALAGAFAGYRAVPPLIAAGVTAATFATGFSDALALRNGQWSEFFHLRQSWFDEHPRLAHRDDIRRTLVMEKTGGYDGQFTYLMAYDPLLRGFRHSPEDYWKMADNPPYRFNRPAYAWLTWLASLGRWEWFPRTMGLLLLAALTALGATLAFAAVRMGRSAAWGLLPVAIPGMWQSLLVFLPEPIAAACLAGAYFAWRSRRVRLAASLAAAALLTRDTTAILVLAMCAAEWRERPSQRQWLWLAGAFLPLAAWRLYVGHLLAPVAGVAAYVSGSPVVGVPFVGVARMFLDAAANRDDIASTGLRPATLLFPFLLIAAAMVAAWAVKERRHVLTIAAAMYGALACSFNVLVWSNVGNGERTSYEVFLSLGLLAIVAPADGFSARLQRALRWFWIAAGAYTLYAGGVRNVSREGAVVVLWAAAVWLSIRAWRRVPDKASA